MSTEIVCGDVMEWAASYSGSKFHALLCDPPYSLKFMGKDWDHDIAFHPETWAALAEHLYPGAFGMAFASSRGWHWLAVAIEDAELIIHPSIFGWCYGSGFPKATRIDTQIDKAAGVERKAGIDPYAKNHPNPRGSGVGQLYGNDSNTTGHYSLPVTDLARAWAGHRYGLQALKPALEPIIVFQKPYQGKPVECITETGAGALNIDQSRIPANGELTPRNNKPGANGWKNSSGGYIEPSPQGRWPANFYLDEEAARRLGEQSGERESGARTPTGNANKYGNRGIYHKSNTKDNTSCEASSGTAARFFLNVDWQLEQADPVLYCAKASRKERDAGLEGPKKPLLWSSGTQSPGTFQAEGTERAARNNHPTVKPLDLCKWLATLLLPPAEYAPRRILVPFAGSGSEMIGVDLVGWEEIIGIEQEKEYVEIAKARLEYWTKQPKQLELIGDDIGP